MSLTTALRCFPVLTASFQAALKILTTARWDDIGMVAEALQRSLFYLLLNARHLCWRYIEEFQHRLEESHDHRRIGSSCGRAAPRHLCGARGAVSDTAVRGGCRRAARRDLRVSRPPRRPSGQVSASVHAFCRRWLDEACPDSGGGRSQRLTRRATVWHHPNVACFHLQSELSRRRPTARPPGREPLAISLHQRILFGLEIAGNAPAERRGS